MTALAFVVMVLSGSPTPVLAAIGGFHAPQTPTENVLDQMLKQADKDGSQLDNLFHRFGPIPAGERFDYSAIISNELLTAMRNEERREVQKECGGHYQTDSICGLDFSPITCSQDTGSAYLYRTVLTTADKATVEFSWPEENFVVATYRLKRFAGVWKIDGVACYRGLRFNFR